MEPGPLERLSQSWGAFDDCLRMSSGFDDGAFDALKQALRECARAWATSDPIPRLGANSPG